MKFFLSTVADLDAIVEGDEVRILNKDITARHAADCGIGIEIADYCVAEYLDEEYDAASLLVSEKVAAVSMQEVIFHAPYNELYPTAIDKKVQAVATYRYEQSLKLAKKFGAKKIVIHSGFLPSAYYKEYFINQSIKFWREFLDSHPGDYTICLENVMDDEPRMIYEIVSAIDDERLRICVDIGHAFVTGTDPKTWISTCAPYLSHLHIHNNYGRGKKDDNEASTAEGAALDLHLPLGEGLMDVDSLLRAAEKINPDITATVECSNLEACTAWLRERSWI